VDSYLPGEWYRASIERDGTRYTLEVEGRFQYGGQTIYRASIDAAGTASGTTTARRRKPIRVVRIRSLRRAWGTDIRTGRRRELAGLVMFGDPHENFYMGSVLCDDVQLEIWK